jgi:hypothetical protein
VSGIQVFLDLLVLKLHLTRSTVDLTIPRYSHHAVVCELAQGLSLFPNVHTFRLVFQTDRKSPEKKIFSDFRYPGVRTLNLDNRSPYSDILRSCPNATHLSFYKDIGHSRHLRQSFEQGYASGVEKLGMIAQLPRLLPGTFIPFPFLSVKFFFSS